MKFKHIIGLDVGTNSLGWCLLKEFEDGSVEIIKTGVHIFPIGTIVDDVSNKEKTKNEQRRSYRGASRMRYRFKLRRSNLKEALGDLSMLPDYAKLFKPHNKKSKKNIPSFKRAQSFELYKLRADAINPEIKIPLRDIGRIFMLLNKYRGFKSNSKKLSNTDKEIGKVKSGYESLQNLIDKSGAKTIGDYFFKMHEKAKELYDENNWHNFNEPIDERAYNDLGELVLFNSNGIRRRHGRYTLRDMYYLEFDKIWEAQKKHYPEILTGSKKEYDEILSNPYKEKIALLKGFKKTNYWHIREYCIYYQRPLKSQKKFVSNCQFERGEFIVKSHTNSENGVEKIKLKRIWKKKAKKACPKSHPYFQEFRIWQKLHQISYSSIEGDVFSDPLKKEWLPIIAGYLNTNYDIHLSKPSKKKIETTYWIGKLLQDTGHIKNSDSYNFFIDKSDADVDGDSKNANKINGNITYASLFDAMGEKKFNQLKNEIICKQEHISEKELINIEESKLLQLWNTIYEAKDGLLKEDTWLKDILIEPTKWNLTDDQAQKIIENGLQPDYGSYSTKVLKAILPHMRIGLTEHEALKAVKRNYINDDNTVGEKVQTKDKISQLAYQELRNPVVERALSKTIKLVNSILSKYEKEIDRNNFEIRIESTRQFKKPRQERENERRKNADKDKLRDQYAAYLTKNKEKLGFRKDIFKYDPIVNKYELWLQMNMNEDDDVFIAEFKDFSKITKQEDKLKHKLWLECGRRCPYTGQVINFTDCFSSEVEIEHIIPLSRSLNDSFNNKTLTYKSTNAEKGSMTPLEYLEKKGGDFLKEFKSRINSKYHDFSDAKKKLLLTEKIETSFSNDQISNTSYIASYTRGKMQEVCKNVQFTNGSATSELRSYDWGLSNLLDKVRYEEDHKINIDDYFRDFFRIKKEFTEWCKKKYNSTDFKIEWNNLHENEDLKEYIRITNNDLLYWDEGIKKFNEFRNKSGKKDRSDHRHHAIDAFVTACCSPKIIKELSSYNAIKEQQHLLNREKSEKRFSYVKLKESILNILVSHSEKQTLIKKRKNRIKTNEGVKEHSTYAPQGSLHKETFYGKLKEPKKQGYDKKDVYVSRAVLMSKNGSTETYAFDKSENLNKVFDKSQKEVLNQRFKQIEELKKEKGNQLKPFSEKAMRDYPIFSYTPNQNKEISLKGKSLPVIKSIRTKYKNEKSLISLPDNKYADKDGNHLLVLYEKVQVGKNGTQRIIRDFDLISFWDGVRSQSKKTKLFHDETENGIGLNKNCQWVQKGDLLLIIPKELNESDVDWEDNKVISQNLYKINELGADEREKRSNAVIKFEPHKIQKTSKDAYVAGTKFFKTSETVRAVKIRLNILGEIEARGEGCF